MDSSVCGGFTAVKYELEKETPIIRHLFIKKHEGKDDSKPPNKTLFVLNVPQYFNEKCLKFLFKHCGSIEHVFIHSKPKDTVTEVSDILYSSLEPNLGYKVAYIVFKEPSGLLSALRCRDLPPLPSKMFITSVGLNQFLREYNLNFLDVPNVTQKIETYMAVHDQRLEEEAQKDMNADEDGWVTISKSSKKPKISRNEKVNKRMIEKQKKESAKKTLLNFYRCQLRDAKMEQILDLRKKFDKDKERIALMKTNRKFKPF